MQAGPRGDGRISLSVEVFGALLTEIANPVTYCALTIRHVRSGAAAQRLGCGLQTDAADGYKGNHFH